MNTETVWLALENSINARRDQVIQLIQDLVRIPSFEGEGEVQALISKWWRERGIEPDIWEPDIQVLSTHPAFVDIDYDYHGRPNQVVMFKGQGGGRSLALNGHTDVVPVDPAPWTYGDPWSGKYIDGRVYGRGSVDMKGGLACGMIVMDALLENDIKLMGDLHMQFVVDEENGGNGTLDAILKGYRGDATIFLEPTSPNYLVVSSRGAQFFRINVPGKEAPIEHTRTTVNVIEKAFILFQAIQSYASWRAAGADHPLYDWDPTKIPVAVCKIQAGSWPSTLPALCIMEGSLECLPGEDIELIKEQFKAYLLEAAGQDNWLKEHPPQIEWFGLRFESAATASDADLIIEFTRSYRHVTGNQPVILGGGGSDLRLPILYADSPSALFGPAGGAIHSTDEYVDIDTVMEAARILGRFILDWCGVADGLTRRKL
ncbi:MAG: ArgE/DapE family deacylase [Anaerolineales bacterium]